MVTSVKRCTLVGLAVGLALVFSASARADGDPAGDVLAQQTVFYGSALDLRSREAAQLPALVERAKAAGYELRVAAMSVQADMGAIDYLWDDPLNYVDFLAQELAYRYQGRVLVIMPSGYAMFRLGHSSVRDQRVLDKLAPAGENPSAVLPTLDAVVALAEAQGIKVSVPDIQPPPGGMTQPLSDFEKRRSAGAQVGSTPRSTRAATSGGGAAAWLFALPVALLVLAAAALIGRNRRRERAL